MIQSPLFGLEDGGELIAETCKTCKHRCHGGRGRKVVQFCAIRHSSRTQNKLLKIKCNKTACRLHEKLTPKPAK